MDRSDEQEESMIEVQPQQSQAIEEIKLDKKEAATIKQLQQILEESDMDWDRIKSIQGMYIIMLALQNIFSLWILLLLYLLNFGKDIADLIRYPFDILFIFLYLYCLVQIQFKQDDWKIPPYNYLLYMLHSITRTFLSIHVIFRFPYIHLEIVYIMLTFDFVIVYLFFLIDKKNKMHCFLAKDYWWRALIIFMIQEMLVNSVYAVYTWFEVIAWFLVYFIILCYVLWECQMIRYRQHITFHFNAFYMGQAYLDSDILFPCSLLKLFKH